ncbi:MAG: helix-turn-helix domain-containing protein [Agriterribacter sp.]
MSQFDTSNIYFQQALQFVQYTGKHIFLTGKAGTGKTTFLKYLREHSTKKMAIVAPTGVAAINAGGTTLHSFFQLPLGPYLPTLHALHANSGVTNEHTLFKNLRFSRDKKELLQELELLVIDEVSMLRADILDEVDIILRHFRNRLHVPFGGVQMLYIGDLFQLPPVVKNEEWELLQQVYKSPFFFDAVALRSAPPVYLELRKIYRQNEAEFIDILNNIRNNICSSGDLERLHQHYLPGFEPQKEDNYITLTTHNARADNINQQELEKLDGKVHAFDGELTGDFNERALPVEKTIRLKEGAQIMFIKNDKGEFRRYYNGKIGIISRINPKDVFVQFPGEENEIQVEKETWKNIRYSYNKEKDSVEEEELGKFVQYPVRLAWAITIHKSQGLTFTKAIIDAGASFAAGQVYVALSRLTSLAGLVLYSRIYPQSIYTDERVLAFSQTEKQENELKQMLVEEQAVYLSQALANAFNCNKLGENILHHYDEYANRLIPDKNAAVLWAQQLLEQFNAMKEVSEKFDKQLSTLLLSTEVDKYIKLHERVNAAGKYFGGLLDNLLQSLQQHKKEIQVKQKVKKYVKELYHLELGFTRQKSAIMQAVAISEGLMKGLPVDELLNLTVTQKEETATTQEPAVVSGKPKKGDTQRMSLAMFKEGKDIVTIASLRGFAISTIEGHLASFIPTNEINITDLVSLDKVKIIQKAIEQVGGNNTTPIREHLSNNYSHGEIRAVMIYLGKVKGE